jgi:hypothetical protein
MKSTVTLSHTRHAYIWNEVDNKKTVYFTLHICMTLRFHDRNETYATQQNGCPTINYQHTHATTDQHATILNYSVVSTIWSSRPVFGSGPKLWRRCRQMLSAAGNTCLSIQSPVPVITFRCHFFVAHSYCPSFLGLLPTDVPRESGCSRMRSNISSDWLPSYIKATRPVLEIFKMDGYFPVSLVWWRW